MKPLICALTASIAAMASPPSHPQAPPAVAMVRADAGRLDYRLQARLIAPRTWVIEGAVADFGRDNGCNIINTAFIATGAGVVVINTGPSRRYGEQQRRLIERTTSEPVVQVFNLNLHPDYFLGNQAWADRITAALPGSIDGMKAEGDAYAENLYRLCGDWMQGTEPTPARTAAQTGVHTMGQHRLELVRLEGHTRDDLVLIDHSTGVLFAGGLVFADRVPTTPHAHFDHWLASLDRLDSLLGVGHFRWVVPSHGPLHEGGRGIAQTRDWIRWLTGHMQGHAEVGLDLTEVLSMPVPARFTGWAAQPAELHRSLTQWYPVYERRALGGR